MIKDGKILLSYEVKTDQWMIPGGGVEEGESYEICCIRELTEETGFLVKPLQHYLTIYEYYEDSLYPSHYFICKVTGQTERMLTRLKKRLVWNLDGSRWRKQFLFSPNTRTMQTKRKSVECIFGNIRHCLHI